MRVLVTGAAGYIGSHACVALLNAKFEVVAYDNFCNSSPAALERVGRIAGVAVPTVRADVRDEERVLHALRSHGCDAVMHFAGLKAVGESTEQPLAYYDTNVAGTLSVLKAMQRAAVRRLVFSSSATVYGEPQRLPLDEAHPVSATNPYGQTKLVAERMLWDLHRAQPQWGMVILRYFNPVGAHPSGLIGEDPRGVPNNLMPYVAQVAVGRREALNVWGGDYPTPDGTGVRDYIHVVDLAQGHVAALRQLRQPGCVAVNLGTGRGYSVLEVVAAFERASGRKVPVRMAARRPGDVAQCYADPSLAHRLLDWRAHRTLQEMCADHWRWQSLNPRGFEG